MFTEYDIALQSQANFTINILNQIVNSNEGVAFSPYSLTLALAMCFIGAGGKTEIEFKNLLSPNVDKVKYLEYLENSINNTKNLSKKKIEKNYLLYFLYTKSSILDLESRFKLIEYLESQLENALIDGSEITAKIINNRVNKITHGKFNNFINSDDIDLSTIGANIYVANKLFLQKNYPLKENYNENMKKYFKATIKDVDYNDSITAAKTINDYVKKITHYKIDNIIAPDGIDSSTKAVLVNALYFKSQWFEKFDKELTKDSNFFIARDKKRSVKMMNMKNDLFYGGDKNFHVVKLLFTNKNSSFVLVLPKFKNKLHSFLRNFKSSNLFNLIHSTAPQKVSLSMPKFKIESSFDLKEPLKKMGIITAFDVRAKFSSMTPRNDLMIDSVFQKVVVDVNEEGTGAVVSTRLVHHKFSFVMQIEKDVIVRADHPFLYFILNNDDILISGVYQ